MRGSSGRELRCMAGEDGSTPRARCERGAGLPPPAPWQAPEEEPLGKEAPRQAAQRAARCVCRRAYWSVATEWSRRAPARTARSAASCPLCDSLSTCDGVHGPWRERGAELLLELAAAPKVHVQDPASPCSTAECQRSWHGHRSLSSDSTLWSALHSPPLGHHAEPPLEAGMGDAAAAAAPCGADLGAEVARLTAEVEALRRELESAHAEMSLLRAGASPEGRCQSTQWAAPHAVPDEEPRPCPPAEARRLPEELQSCGRMSLPPGAAPQRWGQVSDLMPLDRALQLARQLRTGVGSEAKAPAAQAAPQGSAGGEPSDAEDSECELALRTLRAFELALAHVRAGSSDGCHDPAVAVVAGTGEAADASSPFSQQFRAELPAPSPVAPVGLRLLSPYAAIGQKYCAAAS